MQKIESAINYYYPDRVEQVSAKLHYGSGFDAFWLNRHEHMALAVIKEWYQHCDGRVYHSFSGGKDSLVVGHLIRRLYPDCQMVWVNQGPLAEWADCLLLIETLRQAGWNIVELCPAFSLWHLYHRYGIPLEAHMNTPLDKKINKHLIDDPISEYCENHAIQGYSWGIRRESSSRTKFLAKYGRLYQRKDGRWICTPIGFWNTLEVWQYIDRHQLPYPAMYDRDRLTVRNGPPIGTTGINLGRLATLRLHHYDLWAELVRGFPHLRNYSG